MRNQDVTTPVQEQGPALDIGHGALFNASAREYDLYRPGYPQGVIDDIVSLSNLGPQSHLLEIGCGTGKATALFASRGYRIDCVDPGRRLIARASMRCRSWPWVSFTPARFEDAGFRPRSYDLVFSAQAFHWIDPKVRLRKTANLLDRDRSLALVCNYPGRPKDDLLRTLSKLIQRESGGLLSAWSYEDEVRAWMTEIGASGLFRNLRVFRHSWEQRYSAHDYVGLYRTYSDFLSLPKAFQERVAHCIQRVITSHGGYIRRPYDCILIHARKRARCSPWRS